MLRSALAYKRGPYRLGVTNIMGEYGLTFQDYSKEMSTVKVHTAAISAVNLVAETALALAFRTAVAGITSGSIRSERLLAYSNLLAGEPPTDVMSQRENKWLVTYEDTTSHVLYKQEFPTADLNFLGTNTDEIDYTDLSVTAFIEAFELFVQSPTGGASNVLTIKFVGRNL